eukprot:gene14297-24_t
MVNYLARCNAWLQQAQERQPQGPAASGFQIYCESLMSPYPTDLSWSAVKISVPSGAVEALRGLSALCAFAGFADFRFFGAPFADTSTTGAGCCSAGAGAPCFALHAAIQARASATFGGTSALALTTRCLQDRKLLFALDVPDSLALADDNNAEIFTLTYGSIVRQLIADFEDLDEVNKQLEKMGYNIGVRLVDEFFGQIKAGPVQQFPRGC